MPRPRLPILPHLTHDEIAARCRACRSGLEKAHWQALRLLTRPDAPPSAAEVAALVGLSPSWVRSLIGRWNSLGPDGLVDRRTSTNHGREKLTPDRQVDLWDALLHAPPDGGLWTGPKVAAYVRGRWGVVVAKSTGWRWSRGLGFSLQVPRPKHPEAATPVARRAWESRADRAGRPAAPRASR